MRASLKIRQVFKSCTANRHKFNVRYTPKTRRTARTCGTLRKKTVLAVIMLAFAAWQTFALTSTEFDTLIDECFTAFLQTDDSDYAASIHAVQNIHTTIEEYRKSEAFLYSENNDFEYFSTLTKIQALCASFLCGTLTSQQVHRELPLLITAYYRETTETYRSIWFLVLEILVIIITVSALLAVFTILFLRKKRASGINETILQAQETERSRFAYEIHDSVVQDIKAEQLFVQHLASLITKNQETADLFTKIDLLQKKILTNLRAIIKNLSPPQFEKLSFENIIAEYCNETAFINGISCRACVLSAVLLEKLSPERKLHVFRIIQESISNALKHSGADEISVLVREEFNQHKLIIFITDNGKGFNPKQTFSGNHFGLRAMQSRASLIKAKLHIDSEHGEGTIIKLEVQL